jgi:TonB family protein
MENPNVLAILWQGVRSYLQVRPDVFIFAAAFVLGLIFCALALAITGPGSRTTRSSVSAWIVLAGLCAFGPMGLGFYRYWRAMSAINNLSFLGPADPSLRLIIVAPLIIAGIILLINGILYLIALGRYSKLPATLPAGQTAQAQAARPALSGPLYAGLAIFLLLFVVAAAVVGVQVLKARQTPATQAQAPLGETIPAPPPPPQGHPDVSAKVPEQGVEDGVQGGVEGGIEGGVEGGLVGGMPGETESGEEETYIRITGNPPKLIKEVSPVFPEIARTARVEGVVILEAKVGKDGKVREARVLRSIPLLDQAAIDAVKQWEYKPFLVNGEPMAFIVTVTVRFKLT